MKHYAIVYIATLLVMATMDSTWLGVIAHEFYMNRIGDLMDFHIIPAIAFYFMYIAGVVIFVNGRAKSWKYTTIYGALFGFFAYGTYDLTNLATLKDWPLSVAIVDMAWGTFTTATAATLGWLAGRRTAS